VPSLSLNLKYFQRKNNKFTNSQHNSLVYLSLFHFSMSHLKRKIQYARLHNNPPIKQEDPNFPILVKQEIIVKEEEASDNTNLTTNSPSDAGTSGKPDRKQRKKPSKPCIGSRQGSKNIVKNYGRAMSSFACSEMAQPYLGPIAEEENVTVAGFHQWIQANKENIDGIERLRWLLIATPKDSASTVAYKKIFQSLCVIFLKFFTVNWIYGGKLTHKQVHLDYRFKMLRRVRNPEIFTYLK